MTDRADLIVIGGGIVGLAVARAFARRHPGARGLVLEKEREVAPHQTGRNSGVVHSGIYYKPGSLKARTCRRGIGMLEAFCDEHGVERERCGKVIVALDEPESERLAEIHRRGIENGVSCEMIGPDRLRELEPHCAGVRAIHVHDTGIVDYVGVCRAMASELAELGWEVRTGTRVVSIEPGHAGVRIGDDHGGHWNASRLANCAGLYSDRVTRLGRGTPPARIVPFRGEYYKLRPEARSLVRNLIYPVPDPAFPFLGVHFTRMIERDQHGHHVECGPNAVLALAREGYTWSDISPRDLAETLGLLSFWRLAARHWRTGLGEMWRSVSKPAFARALARLVPEIRAQDLEPAPAGVRAQALAPGGRLIDDFAIEARGPIVNVVNAPSPAATASLAIAELICDRLDESA